MAKRNTHNKLAWLLEAMEEDARFVRTRLFSFHAAYLDGRIYLAVKDGVEPWNGMLVCTSRERQAELLTDYPQLAPHKVIGKWLYLSQSHAEFERVATELVALALARDPRLGVEPEPRKKRTAAQGRKRGK